MKCQKDTTMNNPYKELSPYIESDAHSFKGRSVEISEMYESFDRHEYLVCHADSGEGKSSIIEAGLIPKMKANCYFPIRIIFKSDEHFKNKDVDFDNVICGIINNEIEKLRGNESLSVDVVYPKRLTNSDERELTDWEQEVIDSYAWLKLRYARITVDNLIYTPVLIFDQFEEVFTNPQSQEWTDKFFAWLQELSMDLCPQRIISELEKRVSDDAFPEIETQKHFKAIFSLRSEYVGKLDYWGLQRHYIPLLKNNRYLLRPLTIKGAKEVITQQDGYDGLNAVADEIIDILRKQQRGKNYVIDEKSELPCIPALFLSIICSRTFSMSEEGRMAFMHKLVAEKDEDRDAAINSLIEGFYEKAIAECGIPSNDMGIIEDVLVNNEGSRQRVSSHADALKAIDFSTKYMEILKDARLIRVIPEYNREDDSVEFVHDALCPIIAKRKKLRLAAEAKDREERLLKEQAKKMWKRLSLFALFAIVAFGLVSVFLWQQKKANDAIEKTQAYKAKSDSIQELKAIIERQYEKLRIDSILLASHLSHILNDSVLLVSKNDSLQEQIIINQQKDKIIERLEVLSQPRIEHNVAGKLSERITNLKYHATSLSISGQLNGTDIALLREMIINGSLKHLDMENAQIVRGGDAYYKEYRIEKDNVVGDNFFTHCSRLLSIKIPRAITSIGDDAFLDCSGLTAINIPRSVSSIGKNAFLACRGLTSINIPNSVTSIGNAAFSGCSDLTTINIPNSVKSIKSSTFWGCSSLTAINIPNSVKSIEIAAFYGCSGLTAINIPNSVTSIGDGAFSGCSGLTAINIPNSVTSIEIGAFEGCSGLTSINIPNSVTRIGSGAFSGCSGLTSINIPNSVMSIGSGAFSGCSGLTAINIPNSVTSIGDRAFYGCSSLKAINIPNSVTSIGDRTFYSCSSLKTINIPNSVTCIGEFAFSDCSGIVEIKSQIKNVDKLNAEENAFGNRDDLNWIVPVGPNQDKDMYVKKYKEQPWWNEKWKIKHE